MSDEVLTPAKKVEAAFSEASAQIANLMSQHGLTVSVGHFMAALVYVMTEEQLEKANAGEYDPPAQLIFMSNVKEGEAQVQFLASVAEGLAQDEIVEQITNMRQ